MNNKKTTKADKKGGRTMNHKSFDRKLKRLLPFALILTLCTMLVASFAYSADKLVVKDGGGNTKFLVTDTGQVGINTLSPTSQIETSMDGGANSDIRMRVASSGGGVPVYYGMRSGGSLSAPSATPTGKGLFWLGAMGHDGTAWTTALTGLIGFYSTENWTNTTMGTDMRFFTTANGTNTRVERIRISDSGNIGIATTSPTQKLDVNGDGIRIRNSRTPISSADACNQGDMSWDSNYVYVCVSSNLWKRASLGTW